MPIIPTYPGVYVQEVSSGVHPISGVSTADTAFIDAFAEGPVGVATRVTSVEDFGRRFGRIDPVLSPASVGVVQFFMNGGQVAWIVRVVAAADKAASVELTGSGDAATARLRVTAKSPGGWGTAVQVGVATTGAGADQRFDLVVRRVGEVGGVKKVVTYEVHPDLSLKATDERYAVTVVKNGSALVELTRVGTDVGLKPTITGSRRADDPAVITDLSEANKAEFTALKRDEAIDGKVTGGELAAGLEPLRHIEPAVVNLLCIPAAARLDVEPAVAATTTLGGLVAAFCEDYRCFYLVDMPAWAGTPEKAMTWFAAYGPKDRNAAVHFPYLTIVNPDPAAKGALIDVPNSGTMAGLYARTDSDRGVWKAPAGTMTQLRGVVAPAGVKLNDQDSAALNPRGINAIRNLPVYGTVSWGARTLFGADAMTSEWKYTPVRRTALYIEESLVQGLRWVVFDPNDERLWSQIRLNVGAFMQSMFRQGAFQGLTPRDAYLVKCDSATTTQADIDRGIVNILVGFAPLKPAEFVIIQLQQLTRPPEL
jgi:uncharacterized protein